MLIDEITIKIQSGKGGQGSEATYANKSVGGDGGDGGDVYLVGDANLPDLYKYDKDLVYKAENGRNGQTHNIKGAKGKDLILKVPLTTEISSENKLITIIDTHDQKFKILKGGTGLLGNVTLKRKTHTYHNPEDMLNRAKAISKKITLILKLKSDVIFIGYPNVGKSSLLNVLTNTNVKTASYEFTTLEPQRGIMDGLVLMDLPGLIDGSSLGKGLGTKFVRHTENSKLLAHFVTLESENPYEMYLKMRKEIADISIKLANMKELIILTKTDEVYKDKLDNVEKTFKENGLNTVSCSIIDDESIKRVRNRILELISRP